MSLRVFKKKKNSYEPPDVILISVEKKNIDSLAKPCSVSEA